MILQTIESLRLVQSHPSADRFFSHKEKASDLAVLIALRHENQGMVTLAFRQLRSFVFIAPTRLQIIFFTQHT